jgi:hypothetical protein
VKRKTLVAAVGVALVAGGVLLVADPFAGAGSQAGDNGYPTALARVERRALSSQTNVSGTLGYAHAANVVVPTGTAESGVLQAQQSVAQAQSSLATTQAALEADTRTLDQARSSLKADRRKQARDCRRKAPTGSTANPCAADREAVARDEQSITVGDDKVAADNRSLATAKSSLAGAEQSLSDARASETSYGSASSYTMLPSVGQIVRRGQALYAVNGRPVLLLYGWVTAWRAFRDGMSDGPDVAELNANLRALGYHAPTGGSFTSATRDAIEALQRHQGVTETGQLLLGAVVFEPGPVRVTSVTPTLGQAVQPGPVLGVSSTTRQVTIALDAAQQSQVKVGERVTITMPDNTTTPGVVTEVGTVATTPSSDSSSGGNSNPTVEVDVTPSDPAATGRLDQATVQVSITTARVRNALVVPVTALLALSGGGYAVETVDGKGVHHLVPVGLGLFDDADELVQVTSTALRAGEQIVVPSS